MDEPTRISVYPPGEGRTFFSIYPFGDDDWICVLVDGNVAIGAPRKFKTVERALRHAGVREIVPGRDRYWLEE